MALIYNEKLAEGFNYTIEDGRNGNKPFSVTINPVDSVQLVILEDGLVKRGEDNSVSFSTGSYNVSLCRNSLTAWENMLDQEDKLINIQLDARGYISRESLKMLPQHVISEIAGVILSVSQDPKNIQLFTDDDK